MGNRLAIFAALAFLWLPYAEAADDYRGPLWQVVNDSDVIVVATIGDSSITHSDGKVSFHVLKTIKGKVAGPDLEAAFYVVDGFNGGFPKMLTNLRARQAVLFLGDGSKYQNVEPGLYLDSQGGLSAVMMESPAAERDVEDEMVREQGQVVQVKALLNVLRGPIDDEVSDAVDQLSSRFGFRRDQGLVSLQRLGCKALPFIIRHMDDSRAFHGDLRLTNKASDAFEAYRTYAPKQVRDALGAILNDITGSGPASPTMNGGNEFERTKQWNYWLIYLANRLYDEKSVNDECRESAAF